MKTIPCLLLIAIALFFPIAGSADEAMQVSPKSPAPASTAGLPIGVPKDIRMHAVHLGSWIVPEEGTPGRGFHDVYASPSSVEAYRKTGVFPDATVLVKEIRSIHTDTLTTGHASWAENPGVWFVMVKDTKGRYKSSALWGDGWLWALYKADDPTRNVAVSYAADCQACHIPAAKTDHVFVQGYPTLRAN